MYMCLHISSQAKGLHVAATCRVLRVMQARMPPMLLLLLLVESFHLALHTCCSVHACVMCMIGASLLWGFVICSSVSVTVSKASFRQYRHAMKLQCDSPCCMHSAP
jgi:hypothetical protein